MIVVPADKKRRIKEKARTGGRDVENGDFWS